MAQSLRRMDTARESLFYHLFDLPVMFFVIATPMVLHEIPHPFSGEQSNFCRCILATLRPLVTPHTNTLKELMDLASPLSPACPFHGRTQNFC